VYGGINRASDNLAEILKNICEQLPECKALLMQHATEIMKLNDQKNYTQAGSQAIDLEPVRKLI